MTRRHGLVLTAVIVLSAAALIGQSTRPHVDLHLSAERISLDEVTRLVPALARVELPPTIRITRLDATGPIDRVHVSFDAASASGRVSGEATMDLRQPTATARGTIRLEDVTLADLLGRPDLPETVTADGRFDLRFRQPQAGQRVRVDGTFDITSPALAMSHYAARAIRVTGRIDGETLMFDGRAEAYGADVRAEGRFGFGDDLTYDVRGRVAGANVARLPRALDLPRTPTNLSFTFSVNGTDGAARGRIVLADSQAAGARIAGGTTVSVETKNGVVDYRAEGAVDHLDLRRLGTMLDRDWLADERFASRLGARFRVEGLNGSLRSADVEISDSAIFGGTLPQLRVMLTPAGDTFAIEANGRFEGLNPGAFAARPDVDGRLTGRLRASGTVPRQDDGPAFTAADVRAELTLDRSAIEGLDITSGVLVASIEDGRQVAIERGEFAAGETRVTVNGLVGIDGSTETSLSYHATTPALEAFADLIGQPVRGDVSADGTIRGMDTLTVAGTLSGSRVGYGANDAHDVKATYTARVPRSEPAAAAVEGRVEAATVAIGARTFESVIADARFRDGQTRFDVQAGYADQALAASGRYAQQGGVREASLTRVQVDMPGGPWTLADGSAATLRYDGSVLTVDDLRLAAPNQSLAVDGRFGAGESPLRVTARDVQLAGFAPFVNEPDLGGVLDVDAEIRGSVDAPRVNAVFTASAGSLRGVAYQSIGGRADYNPQSLAFDVRLVQPDESWITAQGTLPAAALTDSEARRTAPIDVTVRSSPIDLAIVQALTTQISEVSGTMQADAVIRGTLDDPLLDGQIIVQRGAFSLPFLGTRYTGIDTTILLQPGALVVDRLQLIDDDQDVLTVSGQLPIGQKRTDALRLDVRAGSFEVIDNLYADLEVDAALTIAGALARPVVTGTIDVIGGRINADHVLTIGGASDGLYATTAAADETAESDDPPTEPLLQSPDDGLLANLPIEMDVRVRAPALIIAGRDLKGRGGVPIGLGNINLTTDGDLTLSKAASGALHIVGQVETVRGTYEFQGREFELQRGGSIRFTGTDMNPILNVTAARTIAAVRAEVRITGTLRRPELDLSSRPPLDRADIISLIVFNRPANELGAGERVSLARRATAFATGYLASELTDALSDAVGLDLFEIEGTSGNSDGFAPVLTVGEQLGDLYLRYQQQVGDGGGSQVVVEYEVTDWLRIETSVVERRDATQTLLRRSDGTGIDAVLSWEYGGLTDEDEPAPTDDVAAPNRQPFLYRVLRPRR